MFLRRESFRESGSFRSRKSGPPFPSFPPRAPPLHFIRIKDGLRASTSLRRHLLWRFHPLADLEPLFFRHFTLYTLSFLSTSRIIHFLFSCCFCPARQPCNCWACDENAATCKATVLYAPRAILLAASFIPLPLWLAAKEMRYTCLVGGLSAGFVIVKGAQVLNYCCYYFSACLVRVLWSHCEGVDYLHFGTNAHTLSLFLSFLPAASCAKPCCRVVAVPGPSKSPE